jgi:hypothetical protein
MDFDHRFAVAMIAIPLWLILAVLISELRDIAKAIREVKK